MQDRVGQQFGNYRVTTLLGTGGHADVYLAEHERISNLQCAIKVLKGMNIAQYNQNEFLTEAQTIANLQRCSSHIVQISDFGVETITQGGATSYIPYIVMEYASHGTLRGLYPQNTQVPLERIVFYTNQIAEALQCAHDNNIIHRDVKPENMLLKTKDHVLLSDFGISISGGTGFLATAQGKKIVGTATYIAPERLSSRSLGGERRASDQYSLAVVVYEWISGVCPFDGTPEEICLMHMTVPPEPLYPTYPHVTQEIWEVVARALAKKPEDRYPSVQDFARALASAVASAQQAPTVTAQSQQAPTVTAQSQQAPTVAVQSPKKTKIIASPSISPTIPVSPSDPKKTKVIAASSISPTIPVPPPDPKKTKQIAPSTTQTMLAPTGAGQQGLLIPATPPVPQGGLVLGGPQSVSPTDKTEAWGPQPQQQVPQQAPAMPNPIVASISASYRERPNIFELSPQFAQDQRYNLFLNVGLVLNVLSAIALGFLLQSILFLFVGLIVSCLLFTLCVRAIEEKLAFFFGLLLACYWAYVGYATGQFLASLLNLETLLPSLFIGGIFLFVSLGLHIWYVSKKNL